MIGTGMDILDILIRAEGLLIAEKSGFFLTDFFGGV